MFLLWFEGKIEWKVLPKVVLICSAPGFFQIYTGFLIKDVAFGLEWIGIEYRGHTIQLDERIVFEF